MRRDHPGRRDRLPGSGGILLDSNVIYRRRDWTATSRTPTGLAVQYKTGDCDGGVDRATPS